MTRQPRESSNEHLFAKGLSATGLAVLFLLLRLFAVTDYDWNSAFSIAGTIGVDDVVAMVVGTMMASPVLGGVALALLLPTAVIHQLRLGRPSWTNAGNLTWLMTVSLFTVALLWTYRLWWVLGAAALIGLILYVLFRLGRRDPEGASFEHWFLRSSAVIVTCAAMTLAAIVQDPWVSLEHIQTKNGLIEGYVMENPPGFLKVLTEADREIIIVDTADITGREEIDPEP
ncbi:hypothetical protein [Nocardia sp. NPDC058705]|uniref:hypothetical protein n=1 Tax=Nocardia sp. NPDC058705 TaxID=3346609 RepID=UPI0036872809